MSFPELPEHDELKTLFESDKEGFELKRKELIEGFISSAPESQQESLRKTQELVDSKLQ